MRTTPATCQKTRLCSPIPPPPSTWSYRAAQFLLMSHAARQAGRLLAPYRSWQPMRHWKLLACVIHSAPGLDFYCQQTQNARSAFDCGTLSERGRQEAIPLLSPRSYCLRSFSAPATVAVSRTSTSIPRPWQT
ncbi:hypothetical protein BAUCODRAFT_332734 [Baudoinia panamericana UAMH 10762]|uniref:Uncharacterized protein n=1 Tax=Baudoinia panamericana (strain UAMH 10762) TaxID=717646 RepID=M2MWL4_BAUPA|nr:uncharacterized protein BAUCODRAFT_332734 [Baudoinia panamericana UAMH 10762]EMC90979.1 hypothetical protein BAUCODRAFT_332734 [Baudoinia panamericana UAMH 10762]